MCVCVCVQLRGPAKAGSGVQEQAAAVSIVPIKSKRFDRGKHPNPNPNPSQSPASGSASGHEGPGDLAASRDLLRLLLQIKQGALQESQVADAVGDILEKSASERRGDGAADALSGLVQRQLWTTLREQLRQQLLQAGPHRADLVDAISLQLVDAISLAARSLADQSLGEGARIVIRCGD